MQKRMRSFLVVAMLMLIATVNAQVTTSSIAGKVTAQKEPIIGATVVAIHEASGTRYGAITNIDGRFMMQGMRAGGPYKVEVSYVGYSTAVFNKINLQLGETYQLDIQLKESSELLDEVVVTGQKGVAASRTGAATSFSLKNIESVPTMSRSLNDITRLTPQATVNSNGAISFAGANNRYNSFQIDGAMNNDVFGLTSNGTNGGQASVEPVSLETIEQIQINIAPFDVRQSGFTGGGINAITKSGTNKFHGSAYFFGNTQALIGTTAGEMEEGKKRTKLDKQHDYQWGVTIGGPIIKDKLFFFANYEKTDKSYPTAYNVGDGSDFTLEETQRVLNILKDKTGGKYNANFDPKDIYTRSDKVGTKIDWNINDRNKFTARYSFVGAQRYNFSRSYSKLNASDVAFVFTNKTHSLTAELNSRIGDNMNNEARFSYVRVRDNREPQGDIFPAITVKKGASSMLLGTEYSSCANRLDQDIFTLSDKFSVLLGNHSLIFGTHNEMYQFENLFIQNLYGAYTFNSIDDLENGVVNNYYYGRSKVDVTGRDDWAPSFGAMQLGFYAQDTWNATNRFTLTYGIRMDIPIFLDTPTKNDTFNNTDIAKNYGVYTNRKLSSTPLWSPRLGFRWKLTDDGRALLRGGLGVFTGRIPFVWLSNSFSNTGMEFEKYSLYSNDIKKLGDAFYFNTDPKGQAEMLQNATASTTEVDVFSKDFKFAQNLRANLAFEYMLPGDVKMTLEGLYSKTLNDIYYRNLNYEMDGDATVGSTYPSLSFDNRPMFKKQNAGYTDIMLLDNTSKGYTYNVSLKLEKSFNFGLDVMAAYTYGESKSINSATSSVAYSNWRYNETTGNSNAPELSVSDYSIPHRIVASLSYGKEYAKRFKSTVSLVYTGQSGAPYNVTYYGDLNGDGSNGNDLVFIPTDEQIDAMQFKATPKLDADQQKADLKAFLGSAKYLKDHRGEYYERNSDRMSFEHHFDFRFLQDFKFRVAKETHTLQFSVDIMNVGNLLNRKWGLESYMSNNSYSPITYSKGGEFQYTQGDKYDPFKEISNISSRWRCQLGLRYIF